MPQVIDPNGNLGEMHKVSGTPSPRLALALFYAAKLGHLGIILPFLALWFQERGFDAAEIGMLMALQALFKVLAPWTWGRWADRSGRRKGFLIIAASLACVSLAAMTLIEQHWPLVMIVAVYGFTRSPLLPYTEATALEQSQLRGFAYGPVRLWGSVSFIVVSGGFGLLAAYSSLDSGLLIGAGLLALATLAAMRFPRPTAQPAAAPGRSRSRVVRLSGFRFMTACALMQMSHGAYYSFYSIRLEDLGHGGAVVGALWALAVICEVLLLTRIDRVVDRYGSQLVLHLCLLIAAVRWLMIGTSESLGMLALSQVLHAATYAAFHVAAIRVVFARSGNDRAQAQALYSGMTYGLGIFVGSLAAGWLVAPIGLPAVFTCSAAVALLAIPVLGRSAGPT